MYGTLELDSFYFVNTEDRNIIEIWPMHGAMGF